MHRSCAVDRCGRRGGGGARVGDWPSWEGAGRLYRWGTGVVAVCAFSLAAPVSADADGLYGRFDGDTTWAVGIGGGARVGRGDAAGALTGELRVRFLDAVGPFVGAEGAFGRDARIVLGVELRPLFPLLFFTGFDSQDEWLDLWLQSLSVDLGTALGPLNDAFGAAFLVGISMELPVVLPSWSEFGQGIFLRLTARHTLSPHQAIAGPKHSTADWFLGGLVVLRWSLHTGWVSQEPRRYQLPQSPR